MSSERFPKMQPMELRNASNKPLTVEEEEFERERAADYRAFREEEARIALLPKQPRKRGTLTDLSAENAAPTPVIDSRFDDALREEAISARLYPIGEGANG